MSLPRKGSRKIVVDAVEYRWRIRANPNHVGGSWSTQYVAIGKAVGEGAVLLVKPPQPASGDWVDAKVSIVPADVERYIRVALQSGWTPDTPGNTFTIDVGHFRLPQRTPGFAKDLIGDVDLDEFNSVTPHDMGFAEYMP